MKLDDNELTNLVSSALIKDRLGLDIIDINRGGQELQKNAQRSRYTVHGWAKLKYALDTEPETVLCSTFLVTEASESSFDLLLGKKDIKRTRLGTKVRHLAAARS